MQNKSDLQVIVELKKLGALTIKLIELLPRQYSVTVKDQILSLWMKSLSLTYEANTIALGKNAANNERRLEKQRLIIAKLRTAEDFLFLLVEHHEQLNAKSFASWQKQAVIIRKMIVAWINSDQERNPTKVADS